MIAEAKIETEEWSSVRDKIEAKRGEVNPGCAPMTPLQDFLCHWMWSNQEETQKMMMGFFAGLDPTARMVIKLKLKKDGIDADTELWQFAIFITASGNPGFVAYLFSIFESLVDNYREVHRSS